MVIPQQPPVMRRQRVTAPITVAKGPKVVTAVTAAKGRAQASPTLLAFPGVSLAGAPVAHTLDPVLGMLETTSAQQERDGDYLAAAAMRAAAARIAFLTWRLDRLQRKPQTGGRA